MDYFAYGSNMNLGHLRDWLRRFGVEPEGATNPRRVLLPDHRLRTNYLTASGWGAANVEPSCDDAVEGILLAISPEAREALRAKEGWPRRYEETIVEVILPSNGKTLPALTYRVTPEHRLPVDVPVSPRYRALILDGAKTARLSRGYQSHLRRMLRTPLMMDPTTSVWCDEPTSTEDECSADCRCI